MCRRSTSAAILVCFAAFLACSCMGGLKAKPMCLRTSIVPAANGNSPIPVDLVLIRDKALLKEIPKLSATDWNQRREQYLRDYPEKKQLVDYRWEWVPGQQIHSLTVAMTPKPKAVYLFAGYASKGDHRARIATGKGVNLKLMADDFEAAPGEACSAKDCPVSIQ